MAFRVRYVPLSPRMQDPAPQAKTSETGGFQFVPLTQDILNKAKKHIEDLVRELSHNPVPIHFDQQGFPTFDTTSLNQIHDMHVSAPISTLNDSEQQDYLSFMEQNSESDAPNTEFDSVDESPSDFDMDTVIDLTNLEETMAWTAQPDEFSWENWDMSSNSSLATEIPFELDEFLANADPSSLESIRAQLEELNSMFYVEPNQTSSSSNE